MLVFLAYKKRPWIVKYREPWSGRPRCRSFLEEADALEFERGQLDLYTREREIIRRAKRGRAVKTPGTISIGDLLERYLATLANPTTRATSGYHARTFADIFGQRKAHCLTLDDIAGYLAVQQGRGVGLSTVYRRLRVVRAAYNWAVRWGVLGANPLAGLRVPAVAAQVPVPPSLQEARLLYKAAAPHVRRVIVLGMTCGARIGPSELFRLQWPDVDTREGTIRMPNAQKGARLEYRDIPLRADTLRLVRQWAAQDAAIDCPWVIHHKGKPVRTISRAWHKAKGRAGITRKLRPYDLRHAFASLSLDYNADIKSVSEIMGHRNQVMILQYYRHTSAKQRRKAVNAAPSLGVGMED
jgi:integrase